MSIFPLYKTPQPLGRSPKASVGWWTGGYLAYDAIGAASYLSSKIDLTGNGRNATDINGGLTWAAGVGWTGVATKALSAPALPDGTWSVMVKFNNAPDRKAVFGTKGTLGDYAVYPNYLRFGNHKLAYWQTNTLTLIVPASTFGTMGMAGRKVFADGIHVDTLPAPVGSAALTDMYIGALNDGGPVLDEFIGGIITSFIMFNSTIADAAMAALHTSMP